VRAAFTAHGISIPADAVIHRDDAPDWSVDPEHEWQVHWQDVEYKIQEEHLENHSEARKAGRDRARRDTVVRAPDQRAREELGPLPDQYRKAPYVWWVLSGVGFTAFFAMLLFKFVTGTIDRRRALESDAQADDASASNSR
jgi:hypothetical protein